MSQKRNSSNRSKKKNSNYSNNLSRPEGNKVAGNTSDLSVKTQKIAISEIDDFPGHPFRVRIDDDMLRLVESIRERGVIVPVILRPKEDGRYEMISGHRRKKACELSGIKEIDAEIRKVSRDEAILLMVESNLQRSEILPSEKAFSYKMHLEAKKRQVGRHSHNDSPVGNIYQQSTSSEEMALEVGESKNTIFRYIRLTSLISELLELVDSGRIALRPAVELSYLSVSEQSILYEEICFCDSTPSLSQAIKIRSYSGEHVLSRDKIKLILSEAKPNQREKVTIRYADLKKYIPIEIPPEKMVDYILNALKEYKKPET